MRAKQTDERERVAGPTAQGGKRNNQIKQMRDGDKGVEDELVRVTS